MTALRVHVATTEGPVEVQRLAEEDADVRCVVCLDGTSREAPISGAYDAFVRKPTGVIERQFGHPAYRLDVSETISSGRSWQLGVYLAHALAALGRLAGRDDPAAGLVWASGEVGSDLAVRPVRHLERKLANSAPLFRDAQRSGLALTIVLPRALQQGFDPRWLDGADAPSLRLVWVDTIAEACRALGLPAPGHRAGTTRRRRRLMAGVAGAAALAVLVAGIGATAATWQRLDHWRSLADAGRYVSLAEALAVAKRDGGVLDGFAAGFYGHPGAPAADAFAVSAHEHRAPAGGRCGLGTPRLDRLEEVVLAWSTAAAGGVAEAASAADGLCAVSYAVRNMSAEPIVLWLGVDPGPPAGRFAPQSHAGPWLDGRTLGPGEALRVTIPIAARTQGETARRVVAAAALKPSAEVDDWLGTMLAGGATPGTLGMALWQGVHRIEPASEKGARPRFH